jgi:hypothetical protein
LPETSGGRCQAEAVEVRDDASPLARLCEDDPRSRFQRAGQDGLAFTSDDDDFDGPSSGRDERTDQRVARDIRQAEIAHDHVEVTAAEDLQCFVSATGSCDVGALDAEQHCEHVQHVGRVFDHEDL